MKIIIIKTFDDKKISLSTFIMFDYLYKYLGGNIAR
jgi:hypothetical protein